MKKTVLILLTLFLLAGCAPLKQTQPIGRTYVSLLEIKYRYGLTNKQCRLIVNDARHGKIELIYHAGRDEWMYDATIDYRIYKR